MSSFALCVCVCVLVCLCCCTGTGQSPWHLSHKPNPCSPKLGEWAERAPPLGARSLAQSGAGLSWWVQQERGHAGGKQGPSRGRNDSQRTEVGAQNRCGVATIVQQDKDTKIRIKLMRSKRKWNENMFLRGLTSDSRPAPNKLRPVTSSCCCYLYLPSLMQILFGFKLLLKFFTVIWSERLDLKWH